MKVAGPLTQERIDELWPKRSSKIYFMSHFKNEAHCAKRLIDSVKQVPNVHKIIILIDDTTTDNTEEICKSYGGNVIVKKFKFEANFAQAKNKCLVAATDEGMEQGDWCWVLGGDMYVPPKSAKKIQEYTSDQNNVAGRFNIPEFHPLKNHAYLWPLFFWIKPRTRPRFLLWRHRNDIDWDCFQFVHENVFPAFYRLTRMGDFFAKDQGLNAICEVIHYGQYEDSEFETKYKIFKYAILWQFWRLVQLYGLIGGYENILKQLMDQVCKDDLDRQAATNGWTFFIEYLTRKYMAGEIPEGLLPLYNKTMRSKRLFWSEYA